MTGRRVVRAGSLTALVLTTASLLLALPGADHAWAHDVLRSTTPADGSTVETVPDDIVLNFDQPALAVGSAVVVRADDGTDVAAGPLRLVDTTVSQPVGGRLPAGLYTVLWRVTSADGHVVHGQFTFTARTSRVAAVPTAAVEPGGDPAPGGPPWPAVLLGIVALATVTLAAVVGRRRGTAREDR